MNGDTQGFGKLIFDLGMKLRQFGRLEIGRILGSVSDQSGSYKALIGLLERSFIMRAELNALTNILIDKGVFTADEWQARLSAEMSDYVDALAKGWPEVEVGSTGFTIKDLQALAARSRREGWPP